MCKLLAKLSSFWCWIFKLHEKCQTKPTEYPEHPTQERTSITTTVPKGITSIEVLNEKTMPVSNTNTVGDDHRDHFQGGLINGNNNRFTLVSHLNPITHPQSNNQDIQDSSALFTNCTGQPARNKCIEQTAGEDKIIEIGTTDSSTNTKPANIKMNDGEPGNNKYADFDVAKLVTLTDGCTLGFSSGQIQACNLTNSVIKGNKNKVSIIAPPTRPSSLRGDEFVNQDHDSVASNEAGPGMYRDVGQFIPEKVIADTKSKCTETETTKQRLNRSSSLEDVGHVSAENGVAIPMSKTNILGIVSTGYIKTENMMNAVTTGNNNNVSFPLPRNPSSLGEHLEFNNLKGPCSLTGSFSEALVPVPIMLELSFSSEQSGSIIICGVVSYRKSQEIQAYLQTLKDSKFPMQWTNAVPRICFVQIEGSENILVFDKKECFMSEDFTNTLKRLLLQAHKTGWETKALVLNVANRIWKTYELWNNFVLEELQSSLINVFELGEGSPKVSDEVGPHMEETRARIASNHVSEMSTWMLQTCLTTSK